MSFAEVRFGFAAPRLFDLDPDPRLHFDRLALQGASLGLRLGPLQGNEALTLVNLHPSVPRWTVRLPGELPRLAVDDRKGGMIPLEPRLHTVLLDPDVSEVTVLWAGFAPALRQYLPEEPAKMPFFVQW